MISEGKKRREVAEALDIAVTQVSEWTRDKRFDFKVQEFCVQTQTAMMKEGIRVKANRLDLLEKHARRMDTLLDENGFDAKISRELREYLKQAAIEMGEWTEKKEVRNPDGLKILVEYSDLTTKNDPD